MLARTVTLLVLAAAAPVSAQDPPAPVEIAGEPEPPCEPVAEVPRPARSDHRVAVAIGFSHWFGATFGSPDGFTTPALAVGVRPGLPFLELRLRYSIALQRLQLPRGAGDDHVGFASLEVAATHGLEVAGSRIDLRAGGVGAMVHARSVTGGAGIVIGAEWSFPTGLPPDFAVGVFFDARVLLYVLPGDAGDIFSPAGRRDAQLDLGVVLTFA
jgi:hypothetical protein